MISKCRCQTCGVNIEFDVENAGTLAPCPACGAQTRLQITKQPQFQPAPTPKPVEVPLTEAERVRRRAEQFSSGARIIVLFGVLIAAFCFCFVTQLGTTNLELGAIIAGFGMFVIGVGLWVYLIAQILHIRANTLR